jgi:biotin operon repressor
MNLFDQMVKMERMDWLIRLEATGKPEKFARRLDVSEYTLNQLLKMMKEMGTGIKYDKQKQTYYYVIPERISINP